MQTTLPKSHFQRRRRRWQCTGIEMEKLQQQHQQQWRIIVYIFINKLCEWIVSSMWTSSVCYFNNVSSMYICWLISFVIQFFSLNIHKFSRSSCYCAVWKNLVKPYLSHNARFNEIDIKDTFVKRNQCMLQLAKAKTMMEILWKRQRLYGFVKHA